MERHQVALYIAGLVLGAVVGLASPGVADPAEHAIHPVLALLLYATFLGTPFGRIGHAFRDRRFLSAVFVVNFIVVPVIVWMLSRIVAHDRSLLVGVLFVLLTPCIDYVIVFAGLAGGAKEKLLAVSPLLLIAQMLLLPLYLLLFVGPEFVGAVDFGPFVAAFVLIIALPLVAAALTQSAAAHSRIGERIERALMGAMVPLMVTTLAVVVASQIAGVGARLGSLLLAALVFCVYSAIMVAVGLLAGGIAAVDVPGRRAIVFSGVTRNSLVVLPLVVALPAGFGLAPLVVVTQTLVELVAMIVLVRLVPLLLPARSSQTSARTTTR